LIDLELVSHDSTTNGWAREFTPCKGYQYCFNRNFALCPIRVRIVAVLELKVERTLLACCAKEMALAILSKDIVTNGKD
jgi:hypothetical protein